MTTTATVDFIKAVVADPALAIELGNATDIESFLERAARVGQRIGSVPDPELLRQSYSRVEETPVELSDEALEDVGGGFVGDVVRDLLKGLED